MNLILRHQIFLSCGHGFDYLVVDRRVQQSSLLIIAGATLMRSPLTRGTQKSRLRAFAPDKAVAEGIGQASLSSTRNSRQTAGIGDEYQRASRTAAVGAGKSAPLLGSSRRLCVDERITLLVAAGRGVVGWWCVSGRSGGRVFLHRGCHQCVSRRGSPVCGRMRGKRSGSVRGSV